MPLKLFKNERSAKAAVKRQALHLIEHEVKYLDAAESGYYILFKVDNIDDFFELRNRGFETVLA